jgi:hypothetical protein
VIGALSRQPPFGLAGEGDHAYHAALRMCTLQTIAIIIGVLSSLAGVFGFFLGIANYWERRVSTRPRIVVRPRVSISMDSGHGHVPVVGVMQVYNIGQVPVIGSTLGFVRTRGQDRDLVIKAPEWLSGDNWPGELKPQHSAELRFSMGDLSDELGRAFARTIVGDTFKASRRDMKTFAKQRKTASTQPASSPPSC